MTRTSTFRTAAVFGAFLLAILMIMTVSRAAFSDTTANAGNAWDSGEVILTDDFQGSGAMFSETNIVPGSSGDNCITVEYLGSVSADVALVNVSTAGSTGLAPALNVTISEYDGPGCSGTPTQVFDGTMADADAAAFPGSGWTAAAGDSRGYLIEWSFPTTSDDDLYQNKGAMAAFTWQASSN